MDFCRARAEREVIVAGGGFAGAWKIAGVDGTTYTVIGSEDDLEDPTGTVITMEGEHVVQAVAVFGDLIVAVGSDAEVRGLTSPKTRVVDLNGRTMTPGFYAAHDHFPGSGRAALTVSAKPAASTARPPLSG